MFFPPHSHAENVTLFLSANTKNKRPNYSASGMVAGVYKRAVFWQTVSLSVVYVALWMACSGLGLSWLTIQSSFNLAMKHRMTHGLCIIVQGKKQCINHTPINSDASLHPYRHTFNSLYSSG